MRLLFLFLYNFLDFLLPDTIFSNPVTAAERRNDIFPSFVLRTKESSFPPPPPSPQSSSVVGRTRTRSLRTRSSGTVIRGGGIWRADKRGQVQCGRRPVDRRRGLRAPGHLHCRVHAAAALAWQPRRRDGCGGVRERSNVVEHTIPPTRPWHAWFRRRRRDGRNSISAAVSPRTRGRQRSFTRNVLYYCYCGCSSRVYFYSSIPFSFAAINTRKSPPQPLTSYTGAAVKKKKKKNTHREFDRYSRRFRPLPRRPRFLDHSRFPDV